MATTAVHYIPRSEVQDTCTIEEAAAVLKCGTTTVYSLVGQGEIPASKVGKRLVFLRKDLIKYLASNRI